MRKRIRWDLGIDSNTIPILGAGALIIFTVLFLVFMIVSDIYGLIYWLIYGVNAWGH